MSVTIKDVAAAANVSTATVSKVLNHSPSIPDCTVERIQRIMEEMDYHPNRRAQNFAKKSTKNVLFATHFHKNLAFESPHIFEIMLGLQKALNQKGYELKLVDVTRQNCMEILGDVIAQKSVDGIVLHISIVSRELEKVILKEQFPHIVLGCPEHKTQLCWIDNNNVLSGEIATEFLYKRGYRRMAFIGGARTDVGSINRMQGFMDVHEKHLLKLSKDYICFGESTVEYGMEAMQKLLTLERRPEAVVCADNNLALGVMYKLQDKGMMVPNDMGIITFDAYPYAKITRPKMTTVDIDVYDMGKLAGELVVKKIRKPALQTQSYATLANLVINGTTK